MKLLIDLKQKLTKNTFKKKLSSANSEETTKIFFHVLNNEHKRFSSYYFIKQESEQDLIAKGFTPLEKDYLDPIMKFGNTLYNEEFNLVITTVKQNDWKKLSYCINLVSKLNLQFETKCTILNQLFRDIKPELL